MTLFVGLLAPGIITLWLYSPDLIINASTPKLILLSFSITAPAALINFVGISIYRHEEVKKSGNHDSETFFEFGTSLTITCLSFLIIDFLYIIFGFSVLVAIILILIVNAILIWIFLLAAAQK